MRHPPGKHVVILAGGGVSALSGGVGTLLRYLAEEWANTQGSLATRIIDTRGPGGRLAAWRHFAAALGYLIFHRGAIVCAHIHMTTRGSVLRKSILCLAARALGIPVLLHLHGADFFESCARLGKMPNRVLRGVLNTAHGIIVIGEQWRMQLAAQFDIPPIRINVVPNGVPPAPRAAPSAATPHILFLGRLCERKGAGDLLAALASPALAGHAWSATLAGDGDPAPYRDRLPARATLLGWQGPAQTRALLATAAILVLPSRHEVLPMAVLEAAARGIAIVTTPVGALPEILTHNHNALLVPVGDPDSLAAALATLLADPRQRAALGQAARETWQARLTIAATAACVQALYREAAAGRTRLHRRQSELAPG